MKLYYLLLSVLIFLSCSDNLRNNPVDPLSPNTIIGSISGKVTPTDGKPSIELKLGNKLIASKIISSSGLFDFENIKEASYTIQVKAENYNDLILSDIGVLGAKVTELGTLVLSPISGGDDSSSVRAIFGKVIDSKSQTPIEDVKINVVGPKTYSTTTNSSGTYSILDIDAGQYNISVTKEGYLKSTTSITVNQSGGVEANFSLGPIGVIQGKVVEKRNGTPLKNVLVRIEGYSTYSNSEGLYILSGIQEEKIYNISFEFTNFITITKPVSVVPGSVTNLDVGLSKYGTVKGKVTNSSNGHSISGISVASNYSASTTDENGNYEVQAKPGKVTISFSGNGFIPKTINNVDVTEGAATTLNTSLQSQATAPTGTLRGRIIDELSGSQLTGLNEFIIYLYNPSKTVFIGYCRTDSLLNGNYEIKNLSVPYDDPLFDTPNLPQGNYVMVVLGGYLEKNGYLPFEKNVTIIQGNNNVDINLIKGATVVGNISDVATNNYIEGASISIGNANGTSDNSGNFSLNPVDPELNIITVTAYGYYSYEENLSLQSNQTSFVSVPLVSKPTLIGSITDSTTGEKLNNVRIEMGTFSTYSNSNGAYVLNNLSQGNRVLNFAKEGYKSYVTSVSVPYTGNIIVDVVLSKND